MLRDWHRARCSQLTQAPQQGGAIIPILTMAPKRPKQVAELCRGFARARQAAKAEQGLGHQAPPRSSEGQGCSHDSGIFMTACHKELAGLETLRRQARGPRRGEATERMPAFYLIPNSTSLSLRTPPLS